MDDSKKVEKRNYLSEEVIENFIFSNILHAIDNDYLKLDIEKINVKVNLLVDESAWSVSVSMEKDGDGKTETFLMPYTCESRLSHLRSMMGLTMKILSVLDDYCKDKKAPILRIVK